MAEQHTQTRSSAKLTTDHETIRRWTEARRGKPARVKGTGNPPSDPGILRIDLPGDGPDPNLEPISWDDWFKAFDANRLEFLHEDDSKSRFNKLVNRGSEH
jgi:hypothetical protein